MDIPGDDRQDNVVSKQALHHDKDATDQAKMNARRHYHAELRAHCAARSTAARYVMTVQKPPEYITIRCNLLYVR